MVGRRAAAVPLVVVLIGLTISGVADAGPPGSWTRVTGVGTADRNTMRPGVARGADGRLHVVWSRAGDLAGSILHSAISRDARSVTGPDPIFDGPAGVNESSALVRTAEGLRAFFGATNSFDGALGTATSPDGRSWSVQPTPASRGGAEARPVYAAAGIAAALGIDGTVFSAWGASAPDGSGFHIGLSSGDADGATGSGTLIDPGVGVDSQTGAAYVAANLLDEDGVALFPISPAGGRTVIPRSGAAQLQHPVHITGRAGKPGVYVAYTQGTSEFLGKAAIWNVTSGSGRVLGKKGDQDASVAAAPDGRLWMFWRRGEFVLATRSNPAATRFGRIVRVRAPKGTDSVYDLTGNGSAGPLDVLLHLAKGSSLASWHQRILPGMTLEATLGKGKKNAGKVSVRATDAGTLLAGVKVKLGSDRPKTTGKSGAVVFTLDRGRYMAKATKRGYASASIGLRVR
jgi:hypothetical protein